MKLAALQDNHFGSCRSTAESETMHPTMYQDTADAVGLASDTSFESTKVVKLADKQAKLGTYPSIKSEQSVMAHDQYSLPDK